MQYATDLEKGIKITVDKTDTAKFPNCATNIRYKLDGAEHWRSAADGITLISQSDRHSRSGKDDREYRLPSVPFTQTCDDPRQRGFGR